MQLGNILETAAHPIVTRKIAFSVLGRDGDGRQVKAQATAALAFVDEATREEQNALARAALEARCKGRPIPFDELAEEEAYWFLLAALRDASNPIAPFCPNAEISAFKAALVYQQVKWLNKKYESFVRDEYPELLSDEEQAALKEQAAGK